MNPFYEHMERAGKLIGRMKLPRNCVEPGELAQAAWRVAVGERVASHCQPGALVRGRLIIYTEDSVWQSQLFALRHQILARLEEVLGNKLISELDFRRAAQRKLPQREMARKRPALETKSAESDGIQDPSLAHIYRMRRKRSTA